jgi:diacylglycerol O-acyltransferase/trehalose O-mycolyltransferase
MRSRATVLCGALCALAITSPAQAQTPTPECTPRSAPAKTGLTLVKTEQIDERTTLYSFKSAAVPAPPRGEGLVRARVIVPKGYLADPARRFPVLYHLHGTGNEATTWDLADVKQYVLGDHPVILVMPDGGTTDFYTDWYGGLPGATGPPPAWDTFHNLELVPWIDARLRTNGHRSIAGSSMGGYGAMIYPIRHPGLYDAAASLSGAVDIEHPGAPEILYGYYGQCIYGNPIAQADNYRANNPTAQAARLKGVSLFASVGNGQPGAHDDASTASGGALEVLIHEMTLNFLAALAAENIPATTYLYGNGTHPDGIKISRFYDFDGMQRFLPQAMAAMQAKTPAIACASRRTVVATVRVARRAGSIRSARATLAGKPVPAKISGRVVTASAAMIGLPRAAVRLVITVRLRSGAVIRSTRTYHPCERRRG